jgi:hypothetical protein
MTEVRVSERSDLDTREEGYRRCDAPLHVAMEMATAVISIATETVGTTIVVVMERNQNGSQRRRSKALVTALAPSDWRSCIKRMIW